jgi:uncharacterized membrane protein YeaQ/YmgE (transglycosylase-associated protein family)
MDSAAVGTTAGGIGGLVIMLLIIVVLGGLIGMLARAIMPGPNPMSVGMTVLLGIAGSFIGGVIGRLLGVVGAGGFVLSVLGALLLLWVVPKLRRAG